MKSLKTMKAEFMANPTARLPYVVDMFGVHQHLLEYADMLKDTDISEVGITDNQVVMTFRSSGIKMSLIKGDTSLPPLTAFNFGSYEADELRAAMRIIGSRMKPGYTVLDAGANTGWFSLHVAAAHRNAKVHAFEPIPHAFECLSRNIGLNGLSNIKTYNMGLSDRKTVGKFFCDPIRCGSSSLVNIADIGNAQEISCDIGRLDDIVRENNLAVDFIKCDVEGAELLVFKGAMETIDRYKPAIFTEMLRKWSAKFNYHPNDIIRLFAEHGYFCYRLAAGKFERFFEMDEKTVESNFFFMHPENTDAELIGA